MATKIGTNWWSRRWLEAFEAIDYYGRLSRGKTYFKKGRVISLDFDLRQCKVDAMVSGSAYFPYTETIRFRPLPKEQVKALVKAISEQPRVLAALLHGELPQEVCTMAEAVGIELFPQKWSELKMSCSCPDGAVPCKHLAAVFFKTVEAIDDDPFWLFKFRGVDLIEELKNYGVNLDVAQEEKVWTLNDLLTLPTLATSTPFKEPIEELPLYLLHPMQDTVLSLFDTKYEEKPFTKKAFESLYRQSNKGASQALLTPLTMSAAPKGKKLANPFLEDNGEEDIRGQEIDAWQTFLHEGPGLQSGLPYATLHQTGIELGVMSRTGACYIPSEPVDLLRGLAQLTDDDLKHYSPVLKSWSLLAKLAFYLVQRGAVVPMAYRNPEASAEEGCYGILWLPAVMSDVVGRLVQSFQKHLEATQAEWDEAYSKSKNKGAPLAAIQMSGMAMMVLSTMVTLLLQHTMIQVRSLEPLLPMAVTMLTPFVEGAAFTKLRHFIEPLSLQNYAGPMQAVLMVRTGRDQSVSLNLGVQARGDDKAKPTPYSEVLTEPAFEAERYSVISLMERLTRACPLLQPILESGGKSTKLPKEALASFLFEAVPALTFLGVQVMLPKKLAKLLKPTAQGEVVSSNGHLSLLDRESVFRFDWKIAIGDKKLTPAEFAELEKHVGQVIPWGNDEFVYLDPEAMAKIRAALEQPQEVGRLEVLGAAQTGMVGEFVFNVTKELTDAIEQLQQVKDVPLPAGLTATLRPYQERGYAWLYKNVHLGVGSLIADDMGLGKTLQVITLLLKMKEEGESKLPHLVVVPTTLLNNWCREVEKFARDLSVCVYHGPNRVLDKKADIVLTTYGTARIDAEKLTKQRWQLLVLDEAQAVKQSASQTARALRKVKAKGTVAMTGTPVENRLSELWSIFELVEPGLLGKWDQFSEKYVLPIENEHDPKVANRLKQLIAPFLLRRLKTDKSIISDLPDKISSDHFVSLSEQQAALYQHTLDEMMKEMEKAREKKETGRANMLLMTLMMKLKQICNSPAQFTGETSGVLRPDSGKGKALLDIMDNARATGQKVLIFTQYVSMGELLQTWIEEHTGRRPDFLQGKIPVKKRMEMVDAFQNDPEVDVMIISLKAGGTGLNLVAATVVVHYDLWWNPAVENQATDRAYRIGQKENVMVYRMITQGTFEERINELMMRKRELAELTVATGEQWLGDLPSDELQALFKLG